MEHFIKSELKDSNLYFDISPLQLTSNERVIKAVNYAGINNVLFGTDTPYGGKDNLEKSINRVKNLELSDKDKDLILGINMERLLELK